MADDTPRHRIEVACPECGHMQTEPALVVSTQCRSCRAHFQVRGGKGVVRTHPVTRLAPPRRDSDPEIPYEPPAKPKTYLRRGPVVQAPQSLLMRLFNPVKPPRQINCFNCLHSYTTSGEAQSSQCPKCSGYISLLDYDITENWNRNIQTCGDVVVQKSGVVSGATIQCHNLTILGELSGTIDCSGTLAIRSHGQIVGHVRCRSLRIEKGARVDFSNPVTAESAYISGQVRGQIFCSGPVTLEKRARLQGLVRTSSLIVRRGAKHTGTIEMVANPQT